MNEMFKKLMEKKKEKDGPMSAHRKDARDSVLGDLMKNMDGRDSGKLGMKKVSVMSDSKEGLAHGLDKAKELVGHPDANDSTDDDQNEENLESPEVEEAEHGSGTEDQPEMHAPENAEPREHEHKSPEELMSEIKRLKAELAAKA